MLVLGLNGVIHLICQLRINMSFKQRLFILAQYIIPQHLLSRLIGYLADCQWSYVKNKLISCFIKHYKVDMSQAIYESYYEYKNFNDFFTRALKEGSRPIDIAENIIISPADGAVSQIGTIQEGRVLQAKGHDYSIIDLLGGNTDRAKPFISGHFATIYLSPSDYHRVHMPITGTLREMIYVPGQLFSVNQTTAENVSNLFARNERVICIFDTVIGQMAIVLVGAMIVASIETVWAGLVTPLKRTLKTTYYDASARKPIILQKGAELGRFKLGSTVIIAFEPNKILWQDNIQATKPLHMGQTIASIMINNQ